MNRVILILFLLMQSFAFSQEKMSYYFDLVTTSKFVHHKIDSAGKRIYFQNLKDSTYFLKIEIINNSSTAMLLDRKNGRLIYFEVNFVYKKIEDLNQLKNSSLWDKVRSTRGKRFKNFVEDIEFEIDTVTNKTIVHLTQFKNKKRKKIINEQYYYFGKNNLINNQKNNLKQYLISKYNLQFKEDENLEKTIYIDNGKISTEIQVLNIESVDFNFEFNIDHDVHHHI